MPAEKASSSVNEPRLNLTLECWQDKNPNNAVELLEGIQKHLPRCVLFQTKRQEFEKTHSVEDLAAWDKAVVEMLLCNAIQDQIELPNITFRLYMREYLTRSLHAALNAMYIVEEGAP